jgi:hypothetical protein
MSCLDNEELVKFQDEGHITFFIYLQSWTWNVQWNHASISSSSIPNTVANTDSFHVHLKRLREQTEFHKTVTQISSKCD